MTNWDDFLERQKGDGTEISSGKFTLERKKALEKCAKFQLPSATAWILKMVQAAVACGSDKLLILQTGTATEFQFTTEEDWSLAPIEAAFLNPDSLAPPGLTHLRLGLWSVGVQFHYPFQLTPPRSSQSMVWTGKDLCRMDNPRDLCFKLRVSHRTQSHGKGWVFVRRLEAVRRSRQLAEELRRSAYTCSIPLSLNGQRLDGLQACPTHGFGKNSYPLHIGFANADVPILPIPPLTGLDYPSENIDLKNVPKFTTNTSAAYMVSAHLETDSVSSQLEPLSECSRLYWVLDGVVVDEETLSHHGPVSCAVFVSASGLTSDLTGRVHLNRARRERRMAAVRAIKAEISACKIDSSSLSNCSSCDGGRKGETLDAKLRNWIQDLARSL